MTRLCTAIPEKLAGEAAARWQFQTKAKTIGFLIMLMTLLGSVGIGLVWGWLLGSLGGRVRRPLVVGWSTSLATILVAFVTLMFAERRGLWFFLGATALSLLLHLAWRQELRQRFGASNQFPP